MIRIGVFGSRESVDKICNVTDKNKNFQTEKYYWFSKNDDYQYLLDHESTINVWLFSGKVSHTIVTKNVLLKKPTYYIEYTGSSIHQVLLKASYKKNLKINNLSFDSISKTKLSKILSEVDIKEGPLSIKAFNENLELEDYIEFHETEYKKPEINGCVTCIPQIVPILQSKNIPVFQVLPSTTAIEHMLNTIILNDELEKSQKAQIAVQIFEFDLNQKIPKQLYSTDEFLIVEMNLASQLLKYAKQLNGSMKNGGMGRFLIFTTKGFIEELTNNFEKIPNLDFFQGIDVNKITCGIGIGYSVYQAELHAISSLMHAKEIGAGTWIVLQNNNEFIGPLSNTDHTSIQVNDERWLSISKDTSLSALTISNVARFAEIKHENEFTVKELGNFLKIQPRSAQRIITILENKKYVIAIRTESITTRGRPKKIYKLNFI